MAIAAGVNKKVAYKKETSWGVAPSNTGAKYLRRVSSSIVLSKDTYQSNEIREDGQVADMRHGVRKVNGPINGELSVGTYADFFADALRKDFVAGIDTGLISVIAVTGVGTEFTRSTGSFLTDGFKIGDIVSATGFVASNNNDHYAIVTSATGLVLTVATLNGVALTDEAEGASVTLSVVGKKTWATRTNQTDGSFAIEDWHSDINQSELFLGCKVSNIAVKLPPTGMATVDIGIMGKSRTNDTSQYFTSPTQSGTEPVLAGVSGLIYVGGNKVALITNLDFTIDTGLTVGPVVGSDEYPEIFRGTVEVTGNMSVYFQDGVFRDYFDNETEVSIVGVFKGSSAANTEFLSFNMSRVKMGGSSKDDGEKGLIQSMPFTALLDGNGGSGATSENTTISIQDSLA